MNRRQQIINHVNSYPYNKEITSTQVTRELNEQINHVSAVIGEMRDAGMLKKIREEIGEGGRRWRNVYVRAGSATFIDKLVKAAGISVKAKTLADYSDEELLKEVARRAKQR